MKIFFSLVIACIIVAHVTAFNLHNSRLYNRHSVRQNAADSDVVAALEQRLQAKLKQNQVEVQVSVPSNNAKQNKAVNAVVKKEAAAPVKSATVVKQPTQPEKKPVVQQQTQVAQKVAPVTAPVIKEQQKVQVQKVEAITASQVVAPSSENKITSAEVFEGIGLGALPFVLLPLLLFNSAKGLIAKLTAKPPAKKVEVSAPPKKVQPYTKSLAEGAKEGYAELASGKSTPELDDTRRAYKIVGASFGVGLLAVAFSFLSNGAGNSEVAVAPKVENKVVQVAPKKAEAPKVKVAAPAPVAKVDAKKAEQPPAANAEQKKTVEKKEELKEVEKKEAVATKTEEVKPAPVAPTVTQTAPKAEKVEVKSASEPAPAAAPVVEKVEKKVEEKVAAAVQAPAPAPEKKVESAPVQAPEPVKKAEVAKPAPAPAPAVAQKPAATVKATTTPAVESSEVKTPQVVNVGDSKRVVQQAQPDVVDLSKFQSLRNKK